MKHTRAIGTRNSIRCVSQGVIKSFVPALNRWMVGLCFIISKLLSRGSALDGIQCDCTERRFQMHTVKNFVACLLVLDLDGDT